MSDNNIFSRLKYFLLSQFNMQRQL